MFYACLEDQLAEKVLSEAWKIPPKELKKNPSG